MAKLSASYEVVIIINTKLGEDTVKSIADKFKNLIEENATMDSITEWGKRRLAYAIQDEMEGFYVLYNFTCKPDFPAELDRVLKITDGILRSLITVKPDTTTVAEKA